MNKIKQNELIKLTQELTTMADILREKPHTKPELRDLFGAILNRW